MKKRLFLPILALLAVLLFACKTPKDGTSGAEWIKNEIIVQLKGKVSPRQVVSAYQKYKVAIVKPIDEAKNKWLFTYDTSLIEPPAMLKVLQNSQFATAAEYNK